MEESVECFLSTFEKFVFSWRFSIPFTIYTEKFLLVNKCTYPYIYSEKSSEFSFLFFLIACTSASGWSVDFLSESWEIFSVLDWVVQVCLISSNKDYDIVLNDKYMFEIDFNLVAKYCIILIAIPANFCVPVLQFCLTVILTNKHFILY